jgi:xylan 1,4-beta-xylosidase
MPAPLFHCDVSQPGTPLPHFWEHTVGSCHAPLALRADWQAHLRRCHDELGFRHVRFHGLLSDDMGLLVSHRGKPLYSFFNADQVVDFLLSIGMRPFVELSFMPEAMASGPASVFHYRGNITPPVDPAAWAELIRRLVGHWVARYGAAEVRQWFFEVWNEPNLRDFWAGTQDEYFELYRHTALAIKGVDASLRVGGPATAKEEWLTEYLDFCERNSLPADFVSTHHYPNDVLWYEGQDTETQLAHSRRGLLREWTAQAHARARGRPLYYTEWNCSSNPRYAPQDEPYAAAFVVKTVLEAAGLVECYSFWTFTDLFEENYFPSVPFHGGFGLLSLHGIPKPTYHAFALLHRLGTKLLPVAGHHETVDAWVVRGTGGVTALLTNHNLPRHPISPEWVSLRLTGLPAPRAVYMERIDREHGNPRRLWEEMGAPEYLSRREVEELQEKSRLVREPLAWVKQGDGIEMALTLPPHAVAAVTLETEDDPHGG